MAKKRILILGGSSEGFELAERLAAHPGAQVTTSFAGRTSQRRRPKGAQRVGHFGGVAGLARYLRDNRIDALIDATHPFATQMKKNAARAARQQNTDFIHVLRPEWRPEPGDNWITVPDMETAAASIPLTNGKVLLTVGRSELAPFASRPDLHFIARVIEDHGIPAACRHFEILKARGPFHLSGETWLLQNREIDCIVAKNSGGAGADAKLAAARALGIPVVMVERPPAPLARSVGSCEEAARWAEKGLGLAPLHSRKRPRSELRFSRQPEQKANSVTVVGIGEDGWAGLDQRARAAIAKAATLIGGARHIELLPEEVHAGKAVKQWPSPLLPNLAGMLSGDSAGEGPIVVLASGDPTYFGIGGIISALLNGQVTVIPKPSSVALACAALGWEQSRCRVISICGRPLEQLHGELFPGARLLVLSEDGGSPSRIAQLLTSHGFGESTLHICERMGGPSQKIIRLTAEACSGKEGFADLNIVAVECRAAADAVVCSRSPGLPDSAFENDGQITKSPVRAVTLASLSPRPGELLWDVGAGSGSVGIEWMRAAPHARAIAIEHREDRSLRIRRNADALGVPGLRILRGRAPDIFKNLDAPDAIFIGGGVSSEGMLEKAVEALKHGGRLVANAVSLEAEAVLVKAHGKWGGRLVKLSVAEARPLGGFQSWQPSRPVTQWSYLKPVAGERS